MRKVNGTFNLNLMIPVTARIEFSLVADEGKNIAGVIKAYVAGKKVIGADIEDMTIDGIEKVAGSDPKDLSTDQIYGILDRVIKGEMNTKETKALEPKVNDVTVEDSR